MIDHFAYLAALVKLAPRLNLNAEIAYGVQMFKVTSTKVTDVKTKRGRNVDLDDQGSRPSRVAASSAFNRGLSYSI